MNIMVSMLKILCMTALYSDWDENASNAISIARGFPCCTASHAWSFIVFNLENLSLALCFSKEMQPTTCR